LTHTAVPAVVVVATAVAVAASWMGHHICSSEIVVAAATDHVVVDAVVEGVVWNIYLVVSEV
jgi:hypothetical protein